MSAHAFAPFTIDDRHPVDTMIVAIVFGIALRNLTPLPEWLRPGIKYSVKKVLPFAIVLVGAKKAPHRRREVLEFDCSQPVIPFQREGSGD